MIAGRLIVSGTPIFLLSAAAALCSVSARAMDERAGPPLIAACQACPGKEGISESGNIPNLAGQRMEYLVKQLESASPGLTRRPCGRSGRARTAGLTCRA
jgi:cytochrome c553